MSWRRSRVNPGWCVEWIALWIIALGALVFVVFWLIPEVLRDWP